MKAHELILFFLAFPILFSFVYGCSKSQPIQTPPPVTSKVELDRARNEIHTLQNEKKTLQIEKKELQETIENMLFNAQYVNKFLTEKQVAIWETETVDNVLNSLVRKKQLSKRTTIREMIRQLNAQDAGVDLDIILLWVQRNTAHITITNQGMLSGNMGSTGPYLYMAGVTASLTSIPGIDRIWLHIEEGDHWGPGELTRANFIDLFIAGDQKTL